MPAARSGPHLLIENVDMHSQQSASKPPAAHLEKLLSKYGTLAALVVLPGLAAAAVTFSSADAAEEVLAHTDHRQLPATLLFLSSMNYVCSECASQSARRQPRAVAVGCYCKKAFGQWYEYLPS